MSGIENLIATSGRDTIEGYAARLELVRLGASALPALAETVRSRSLGSEHLFRVIRRMRDPDTVPELLQLLVEDAPVFKRVALEALGRSRDKRALPPLIVRLLDKNLEAGDRALVARALGELGMEKAVAPLQKVVTDFLGPSQDGEAIRARIDEARQSGEEATTRLAYDITVVTEIVVALAKLGHQEQASIVIALSTLDLGAGDPRVNGLSQQDSAAAALKYLVGPGLVDALKAARRRYALDAIAMLELFVYLGTEAVVEELIQCVVEGYPEKYGIDEAIVRIERIAGLPEGAGRHGDYHLEAVDLQTWWLKRKRDFEGGTCYCKGKPIAVGSLAAGFAANPQDLYCLEHLRVMTGNDFGYYPGISLEHQPEITNELQEWAAVHAGSYEPGGLYRYGFLCDL